MAADCLTKLMKEDFLQAIIESNRWNSAQTTTMKAVKLRKAEGAQRRKAERHADEDDTSSALHAKLAIPPTKYWERSGVSPNDVLVSGHVSTTDTASKVPPC